MLPSSTCLRRSWSATLSALSHRPALGRDCAPSPWALSLFAGRSRCRSDLSDGAAAARHEGALRAVAHARAQAPGLEEAPTGDWPSKVIGQVMSAEANFVRVKILQMGEEGACAPPRSMLLCVVRSVLKKMRCTVLVGDRVKVIAVDWTDGRGMVEEVLERDSELAVPGVANVDHVMVMVSAADPPFEPRQVTRFLLAAQSTALPVSLVVNKMDLVPLEEQQKRIEQMQGWGLAALPLSVTAGLGLDQVASSLKGRVSVVMGPSGVGKSSFINALRSESVVVNHPTEDVQGNTKLQPLPAVSRNGRSHESCKGPSPIGSGAQGSESKLPADSEREDADLPHPWKLQAVQEVSAIGRGKHTTRHVSLLEVPGGGLLADTPGFNLPDLSSISLQSLPEMFPEVAARQSGGPCRFSSCQHLSEPGCRVRGDWERYPIYVELHGEVKRREEYERRTLQLGKKQREGNFKVKIGKGGQQEKEALLEMKKHRRRSRRLGHQDLQRLVLEEQDMEEDKDDDDHGADDLPAALS
ncbi:unnamed protein product [Ostreobium quekettii]|uniref:Ribosome biogenesis GTPase RsgA n=1 Tax=Ostreobium quekettii TaxID=121088 RepID=A0A8S1JG33_9CHLO|nr:unnamed protein product [Ostreobium quekettii]|eukprot:evm.model.scf_1981.1 EVM.evm.TU.scf_1981.1   scf_1981:13030-18702(-)